MLKTKLHSGLARLTLVCVIALSSAKVVADGDTLRNMPLPHNAKLAMVGENILQNGSRVSIATFASNMDVDSVLGFYRLAWQQDGDIPGFVENDIAPWRMIARLEDGINLAVQLEPDGRGGSKGLVSALDVDTAGQDTEVLPMPAGTELLSTTGTQDGSREANTWFLRSRARPGEVAGFYIDRFESEGWNVVSDRSQAGSSVVLMSGQQGTVEVTASRSQGGTFVVVNRVRSGS